MRLPRRLTFQLTPLLDLLLIVIFAQYLEVQHTAARAEQEIAQRAEEQTEQARAAQRRAEGEVVRLRSERQDLQNQLQERLADVSEEMQRALNQRRDLADLVAKLFQIPQDVLDAALAGQDRSEEEQQQIRAMVDELAEEHRNEVIKHLITHQAMRKRVDVWTLFITGEGNAQLKVAGETKVFRVRPPPSAEEARRLEQLTPREQFLAKKQAETEAAQAFAQKLFNAYQTLPQPKSVVVLVVSWNPELERYYREPVRKGLQAVLRMFHSNNDRTQFIPAVLGAEME